MADNGKHLRPIPGKSSTLSLWKVVLLSFILIAMLGLAYLSTHVSNKMQMGVDVSKGLGNLLHRLTDETKEVHNTVQIVSATKGVSSSKDNAPISATEKLKLPSGRIKPVLGEIPTKGAVPLYGKKHKGGDAIFALACNYPMLYYQRFVGSLRKVGYDGDIVLAVSPPEKMKPGVGDYCKETDVVAYGFDVDCEGKDNCKLQDEFLGYPDPRPMRTFANIRYALYEYWLQYYTDNSYILILDFRDTFFQGNPFQSFGIVKDRTPKYELHLFEENADVKSIGNCVYNSLWVGRCFGKPALEKIQQNPVLCSGSTLGSFTAISYYVRTMLSSMDEVKCWLKGIESDQGYQNYLYYNGFFNVSGGTTIAFRQGTGIVNTIGALNGHRVPKEKKGPLDTYWKARDKAGYIINYDGTRSACVHQWDRWYKELSAWVDATLF
jgi:hypothetical protein